MCKSLLEELRFTIGEQYELNEFNLKAVGSTIINGLEYDSYEYIKNDFKALFGVEFSKNIVLQYNCDILSKVIYEFDMDNLKLIKSKASKINITRIIVEVLIKDDNNCQLIIFKS